MKKLLLCCFLAAALPLAAQQSTQTNSGFISSTQCVPVPSNGLGSGSYSVTGTWSGTLTAYGVVGQGTPASIGSVTANGSYVVSSIAGYTLFEVCGNTVASGAAFVQVYASPGGGSSTSGGTVVATQSNGSNLQVNVANNQITVTGALTTSSSATCTGAGVGANGVTVPTAGAASVGINVSNVYTGTPGFYYSIDGTNYQAVPSNVVFPAGGGTTISALTTGQTGQFTALLPGGTSDFMVCGTTATGTATITLEASLTPGGLSNVNLLVGGVQVGTVAAPGGSNALETFVAPANTTGAVGALTTFFGASVTTGSTVKGTPGNLYAVSVVNNGTGACVVEFFNTTSITLGVTTPVVAVSAPASSGATLVLNPFSSSFSTAIGVASATTGGGSTACATAPSVTAFYR